MVRDPGVVRSYLGTEPSADAADRRLDLFHGDAQALADVSLLVEEGSIVAIVGANGAGKTSLIRAIAGMRARGAGEFCFAARTSPDGRAIASAISASARWPKDDNLFHAVGR